jgi:2-ketoarginine methyltransferase
VVAPDFARRLIENTQPIRYFFLAQALHHALELGVFAAVAEQPGRDCGALAAQLGLDPQRLLGLLQYLENECYLVNDDGWALSPKGMDLPTFAPWYEMLVGGYAPTMQQLGDVLRPGASWATRDTSRVGSGSCRIGTYDTMPIILQLLRALDQEAPTLVDLGCGDSGFLAEILLRDPRLTGIGMDPHPASIERGTALRAERGVAGRLELFQGSAADVAKLELPDNGKGTCFMTAFVLQEMLEQDGEAAVEDLLRSTFDTYPEARWLVAEMDYRPTAAVLSTHGLGLAFYNPYFLIHSVTEQRLKTRAQWRELTDRIGLTWLATAETDDRVDSTGLQFGFLLARA